MRIRIPSMLLKLRERAASEGRLPGWLEKGMGRYASIAVAPKRWARVKRWAHRLTGIISSRGWIRRMPGPGRGWTRYRDFPRPAKESFLEWWRSGRGP